MQENHKLSSFSKDKKVSQVYLAKFRRGVYFCVGFVLLILGLQSLSPISLEQEPKISDFSAKPTLVGYLHFENKDDERVELIKQRVNKKLDDSNSPKVFMKNENVQMSRPRQVLRIHPETFQLLKPGASIETTSTNQTSTPKTAITEPKKQSSNLWWATTNPPPRKVDLMGWDRVIPSSSYAHIQPVPEPEQDCQLPHPEWQKYSYPTCNSLHEMDSIAQLTDTHRVAPTFLLGSGSMRDVWLLETSPTLDNRNNPHVESTVLKTLRINHDFDDDDLDRHRRDALISERLKFSQHILDIYGYCGASAIYEWAQGGSLYDAIGAKEWDDEAEDPVARSRYHTWTSFRKFKFAWQAVSALADLHFIDKDFQRAEVVHGDIDITQFVSVDRGGNNYKLSDFNGAKILEYSKSTGKVCKFSALMRGGKTRSPEEYARKEVDEKIDVFCLGNALYTLLVG